MVIVEGTEEQRARQSIQQFSQELVRANLLEYYGGNLSVRVGKDRMMITRSHVNKAVPTDEDIIPTAIFGEDENTDATSSAWLIHQAIYRRTDARAVIHAHPAKTVTLSLFKNEIVPIDENGVLYLGHKVKVVAAPILYGWNLVAEDLAEALVDSKIVILKWHGSFAKGADLADAFHRTRGMEFTAEKIIDVALLRQTFGEPQALPMQVADIAGGVPRAGLRRFT